MKKTKIIKTTQDAATIHIDAQLHVVMYAKLVSDKLVDDMLNLVQKTKHQPIIHIITEANTTAPANGEGKPEVNRYTNELPVFDQANHFVWIACADTVSYTDQVINYFYSNKKLFTGNQIVAGTRTKESGKSGLSLVKKASVAIYNFYAQLLMPHGLKQQQYPFLYTPTAVWNEVATHYTTNNQLLLAAAAMQNETVAEIPLTTRELKNPQTAWASTLGNAFIARLNAAFRSKQKDWWRTAFYIISVLALFALPLLSQQFGMTWDEKRHNEYSKLSLNYFMSGGEDTTCLQPNIPTQEFRYYGEHMNVIAAFLNEYVLPLGEYETRHLLNAIYAFFAMLFAALIAKELAGWRAGTIAWLSIVLSPVFFAHGMNNPTDIPFATGFAIAIYYLFKISRSLPSPKWSHVFMAAVGVGVAVGSRVGGVLLYAYAGLFMLAAWYIAARKEGFSKAFSLIPSYALVFLVLLFIGHTLSISLWPFGQQSFFTSWYDALKQSTEGAYFTFNHELFEGNRIYMANVPWYYLPKFILINAPVAVIVGLALSVMGLFALSRLKNNYVPFLLLWFTILFPIVYAEFKSLYYYNGWRHYLFIYPFIIAASAIGWDLISRMISKYVALLPLALLILPLSWMIQNHPNQTVYFNELVGGTKGAYGKYELDYYSNSCREAGEWIAEQHPNDSLVVGINNEPLTAAYYAHKKNPKLQFMWMREYEEQKLAWDYAIITTRTFSANELLNGAFPPKGTVHTIEAGGAPILAIVKRENYYMPNGYVAFQNRNADSAKWYFLNATQYNPMDEEAWRMLGNAYMSMQQPDSAKAAFNRAIEIYPENYMAYNDIGLIYANMLGDAKTAITYFDKAISIKVNYADGYYYASAILLGQRDFYGAISYLERGIKNGGKTVPEFYYNLAYAYLNTNNYKKAEEQVLLCLSLNRGFGQAYQLYAQILNAQGRQNEAKQLMQQFSQYF